MSKLSTRHINLAQNQYHVFFHDYLTAKYLSVIDQGANGGVSGEDVRVIFRNAEFKDIDNHHANNIGMTHLLMSSLPLILSGTPLVSTMNSLMNYNGSISIPPLLVFFLPL
jgi:hypothetical protein